jgi:hypothetical protein
MWLDQQRIPGWMLLIIAIPSYLLGGLVLTWPWIKRKWRMWKGDATQEVIPLPEKRPKVVATRLGKDGNGFGLYGLFVTNDGEPAHQVSMPKFDIGHKTRLETNRKFTRLVQGEEKFFPIWLEEEGLPGYTSERLFDWVRTKDEDRIVIPITYSGDGIWYETKVTLERNVESSGGFDIRSDQQRIEQPKLQ